MFCSRDEELYDARAAKPNGYHLMIIVAAQHTVDTQLHSTNLFMPWISGMCTACADARNEVREFFKKLADPQVSATSFEASSSALDVKHCSGIS